MFLTFSVSQCDMVLFYQFTMKWCKGKGQPTFSNYIKKTTKNGDSDSVQRFFSPVGKALQVAPCEAAWENWEKCLKLHQGKKW